MNETLYRNIENSSAHRPSRDFNSGYIFGHPELFPDLMSVTFNLLDKNHHKACWILELVLESQIEWLVPYLDQFCRTLPEYRHEGALRSISKICMFAAKHHSKKAKHNLPFLDDKQIILITESCFDWLINDSRTATKAYAMRALYETGKQVDWIYPELREILSKDFPHHSPAYQAAAKELLRKI